MKSSKKGFGTHGNESKTHKPSKHDANLQKNSTLRFQIGLVLSSLIVLLAFQINFNVIEYHPEVAFNNHDDQIFTTEVPIYKVYEEPVKEKSEPKTTTQIIDIVEVVPDDFNKAKENVIEPDISPSDPIENITYIPPVVEVGPVDFKKVEEVPIFPGCESLKTNDERKTCMSEKIDRIVRKNFRTNKAVDFGLTGKQKIYVQFKINKQGMVSNIQIRAPHKLLEDEARRVTKLIPQMKPGMQRSQAVEVVYLKPIVFSVQ